MHFFHRSFFSGSHLLLNLWKHVLDLEDSLQHWAVLLKENLTAHTHLFQGFRGSALRLVPGQHSLDILHSVKQPGYQSKMSNVVLWFYASLTAPEYLECSALSSSALRPMLYIAFWQSVAQCRTTFDYFPKTCLFQWRSDHLIHVYIEEVE